MRTVYPYMKWAFRFMLCLALCVSCARQPILSHPPGREQGSWEIFPESGINLDFKACAVGDRILVQLKNNTPASVSVSPRYFGMIREETRSVVPFSHETARADFPRCNLPPGAGMEGILLYPEKGGAVGKRIVFNPPGGPAAVAVIEFPGP